MLKEQLAAQDAKLARQEKGASAAQDAARDQERQELADAKSQLQAARDMGARLQADAADAAREQQEALEARCAELEQAHATAMSEAETAILFNDAFQILQDENVYEEGLGHKHQK